MTLQEFAERCVAKLAKRQKAEDNHMTSTVLEHSTYAKRVGASRALQEAAGDIWDTLKEAGEAEADDD